MALLQPLNKSESFKKYFESIKQTPTIQTKLCFSTGLPGVWLYLKSLGIEELYFDLISKAKRNSDWFKELIYLLMVSNKNNKFFPKIKDNILDLKIPKEIKDAEVELPKPDFEMVFAFNLEQLEQVLQILAVDKKMIRFGNNSTSVAVTYEDEQYKLLHGFATESLSYKDAKKCAQAIMRALENG